MPLFDKNAQVCIYEKRPKPKPHPTCEASFECLKRIKFLKSPDLNPAEVFGACWINFFKTYWWNKNSFVGGLVPSSFSWLFKSKAATETIWWRLLLLKEALQFAEFTSSFLITQRFHENLYNCDRLSIITLVRICSSIIVSTILNQLWNFKSKMIQSCSHPCSCQCESLLTV